MNNNKKYFSLWVGGVEVNDHYLTKEEVQQLEKEYINKGYIDVIIERVL